MQNQPMQIDRKEFKELLKEIQKYNKIDLLAQGFQTKYAKEAVGVDDEQRRKDAIKTNELLESILLALSGAKDKAGAKVVSIKAAKKAREDEDKPRSLQDVRNLIKEDLLKFKGELKTGVAFGKKVGGGIADAVRNPLETMKKVGSGIADFGKSAFGQAKDVLSTPSSYKNPMIAALQQPSAAAKTKSGGLLDNPNVVDSPTEVIASETEKQNVSIKELLDVSKQSLDQLKAIRSSLEGAPATRSAQPASKTPPAPVAPAPGPAAAEGGGGIVGDAVGAAASGIGGKIMGGLGTAAKAVGGGLLTAGKAVGGALLSKPALIAGGVALAGYAAYKGYKALTGGSEAKGAEGEQAGGGKGESTSVEVKETSKVSLAKFAENDPKGFQEYQKFIQEEMDKGEKQIEKDFKSGKKKGAKEVFLNQLERDVQERARAKFKDKMIAAGAMETKTSVKGEVKGKDGTSREMTVDELKAQRQKVAEQGPRTKTAQSQETHQEKLRTMDAAIADKERKQAAVDPTGMGDDSEYKRVDTGSLRQGQQGIKAQHEQFMKDTKPGSGYKEEPAAPKKTIGQRIAGFFGFGKKEESKVKSDGLEYLPKNMREDIDVQNTAREKAEIRGETPGSGYKEEPVAPKKTIGQRIASFFGFGKKEQQGPAANVSGKDKGDVDPTGMGDDSDYGPIEDQGIAAKGRKLREEATKLGLDPNTVQGKFEGGVLTGITEKGGKTHNVEVSEKDRNKVEAARAVRAANEKSATVAEVAGKSAENAAMKDQMAATSRATTPVVSNNVQTNNTTAFMPAKADPRPTHKGSALERYNDRIATF